MVTKSRSLVELERGSKRLGEEEESHSHILLRSGLKLEVPKAKNASMLQIILSLSQV